MLAVQEKIDPAVLLFTYIKDPNKNKKSTKKKDVGVSHTKLTDIRLHPKN